MADNSDENYESPKQGVEDTFDESNVDKVETDEDILCTARKRFDLAAEAESSIRREAIDDLKFRAGEQWPDDIRQAREIDKRPCLTINRLPQFIRQITNDQRQNPVSIKVSPVDDKATVETAKVLQGLIRHIEYASNADVAYDRAFDGAATHGFGYFRIITDYCDHTSFDLEARIKSVRNPFSVYFDPAAQEPDGSDAEWAQIVDDLTIDDYKSKYPNSTLSKMPSWNSIGDRSSIWVNKSTCKVAEYFYKTYRRETLVKLSDGRTAIKSALPKEMPEGITVVHERETVVPSVQWCKHNGYEILEKTEWPGQWIPIVPVYGDEIWIEGRRILEGIIRHAKDPQRMHNYWASSETETIALAPRAPWIVAEGQTEGYEQIWNTANVKNHSRLPYKPTTIAGQPVGPPQRNVFEAPVQAITQARMQSAEDIKSTTGIYDATLGNLGSEQSGIAIQRRNNQSQTANFHLIDNLRKSVRHGGRILVDIFPKVYDVKRSIRIVHEDDTNEIVLINQIFQGKDGQDTSHQLDIGQYDVAISEGPNYQTKRQEAVASMLQLVQSAPQTMQAVMDLLVRNMDWEGSQEIADRLKKMLPPGLGDDPEDKQMPIPPQVQAQIKQMGGMLQTLTKECNELSEIVKTNRLDNESKERIEALKAETQIKIAFMKDHAASSLAVLETEMAEINKRRELIHNSQSIDEGINQNASGPNGSTAPGNETQAPQVSQGIPAQNQQPTGGPPPG